MIDRQRTVIRNNRNVSELAIIKVRLGKFREFLKNRRFRPTLFVFRVERLREAPRPRRAHTTHAAHDHARLYADTQGTGALRSAISSPMLHSTRRSRQSSGSFPACSRSAS